MASTVAVWATVECSSWRFVRRHNTKVKGGSANKDAGDVPVREQSPYDPACELETIRMGTLGSTGNSDSWMDCPKCKCGLKTSDLFLVWAVTLQVHQRVYKQFHTTVHWVIYVSAGSGIMWRWPANRPQTCFATDNQPALRDVSSRYDWELGRHNNIYIDVSSCNCYMLFLCYCKDAICDSTINPPAFIL